MNIAPGKPLELLLRGCSADAERRVNENRGFLQTLALSLIHIFLYAKNWRAGGGPARCPKG